jgi:hypothetical protein
VLDHVTITKDPRTDLVITIGGTEKATDILQRAGGSPHGLPVEQQRLKATTTRLWTTSPVSPSELLPPRPAVRSPRS